MKGEEDDPVTRYTVSRTAAVRRRPGVGTRLIIEWPSDGHNGGDLAFGRDGMLYVTSGDGTSDSDTNLAGQDLSRPARKRPPHRRRSSRPHGQSYSVPKDNPFVGQEGARPRDLGLRLPQPVAAATSTRRPATSGSATTARTCGSRSTSSSKGGNYGWSVYEGQPPVLAHRKQRAPTPIAKPDRRAPSLRSPLAHRRRRLPRQRAARAARRLRLRRSTTFPSTTASTSPTPASSPPTHPSGRCSTVESRCGGTARCLPWCPPRSTTRPSS